MKCHNCGNEIRDGARFCDECGEKQGPGRQAIFSKEEIAKIQEKSQPEDYATKLRQIVEDGIAIERRDVAVLFVDVSGFTPMFSTLPSDELREVMRDVYSVMSGAITRCGGYVDKFIGDEVMAIFGAPIALERPCERAITAVDEIEIGLAGVNHRFKEALSAPLSVHAGIAFGTVEAGRFGESQKLEYTILGETVNLAKRMTDKAPSETILATGRVRELAQETFEFESLGVQEMPGIAKPLEVFCLVGPKPVLGERVGFSELGASMFGRDEEFGALKAAFKILHDCYPNPKPCEAGEGKFREFSHIFGITGEAGIGKSRLKRELKRHIRQNYGSGNARFLIGSSWGIGKTPSYWLIKEQIASALGFDLAANTQVIEDRLSRLKDDAAYANEHVPYIYHLFGLRSAGDPLATLKPKSIKDNLWIAIRKLYERWSVERPLILVFEDVHWADGGTRGFIEYLVEFIADFPAFVLLLYRPGYDPRFAKIERIPFTEMTLGPLSKNAETDLLSFYLASGLEEQALVRRVRKYSEGNPLFAEEFLHLLLERGKLRLEDDKMHLTGPIEAMPLPTGLSGVLAERFDRLSRSDRRVAYYGAVIGRSFLHSLLSDLHSQLHGATHIQEAIQTLLSRDIIFERAVQPELEYTFKHALTREMLVSRLLDSLRRELSKLAAARIEELYVDRLEEFHGTLSEHYEAAGDIEEAARHAAFHAIHEQKHQNNFDALDAFERYDRMCQPLDKALLSIQEQADLLRSRFTLLKLLGRTDDALIICDELAALEHGRWLAKALSWRGALMEQTSDYQEALRLASRALELARQQNDARTETESIQIIGIVHQNQGEYKKALRCYEKTLEAYRSSNNKHGVATIMSRVGAIDWSSGEYDEALRCFEVALAIYREFSDKRGIAKVMGKIGVVHNCRGDLDGALRCYEKSVADLRELGDRLGIARITSNMAIVQADRGDFDEALRNHDEALLIGRQIGNKTLQGHSLGNAASVYAQQSKWAEARESALEAERLWRETGSAGYASGALSILCRCSAVEGDWSSFLRYETEALSVSKKVANPALSIVCMLNLAWGHLEAIAWHDQAQKDTPQVLSRDQALGKAVNYAKQAEELAEASNMEGFVKKAAALLDEIEAKI